MRANLKWKLVARCVGSCLALMLIVGTTSCERSIATMPNESVITNADRALATTDGPLSEVNIPESIAKLAPSLEKFQPQVKILSPQPNQILNDDRVTVKLQLNNLPLFKSPKLGLGNHLHVILDKQTYQGVYDLTQPLEFKNLTAGTHTLRIFASRPWHESFKNRGAYAQTTFHVFTKTAENNPDLQQPLLTYSRPAGTYGAEPIMLDYYLTNAPTQSVANSSSESIPAWKIRATVNNQQFIIDRWTPVYLQGVKLGKNLVRLELVDDRGQPILNVYNDNVSIINYDPQSQDSLAKLVRGEINPDLAQTIVDPNYIATKPISIPTPTPTPVPTPAIVAPPIVEPVPSPIVITQPQPYSLPSAPAIVTPPTQPAAMPAPIVVEIPKPAPVDSPEIVASPQAVARPNPVVIIPTKPIGLPPSPAPAIAIPSPTPTQKPMPTPTVQPQVLPSPAPASLIPSPAPISIDLPVPATPLAPEIAKIPVVTTPQPVVIPSPTPILQPDRPSFEPATSIRQAPTPTPPTQAFRAPAIEPSLPTRSAPIETPTATAPQTVQPEQETWQTKSIELIKFAGVKIRAFTNTIPAKAQRFGQNVQILAGKAIETIRSWQDQG